MRNLRKNKKFMYLLLFILFLSNFNQISLVEAKTEEKNGVTEFDFGRGNEEVFNIDHLNGKSKSSLLGKLITSDRGRVVRLVELKSNGEVLVNEGINPQVVAIFNSLSEATKSTNVARMAAQTCTTGEYVDLLFEEYDIPKTTRVKVSTPSGKKKLNLNVGTTQSYRIAVYGDPEDIRNNSKKNGQWEYKGYNEYGGWVINDKYPETPGSEFPDFDKFLDVNDFRKAEDAYWLTDVWVGKTDYPQAVKTIEYFSHWGKKITSVKSASSWLSNEKKRIKLQGLLENYKAGLGITEYKSSAGSYWYQTYMIMPEKKLPITCTETISADLKAVKLTGKQANTNINVSFTATNNHKEQKKINAKTNVKWLLTWEFKGVDEKGRTVTKEGDIAQTKPPAWGLYWHYGTEYTKSYSFSPRLNSKWAGTVTITATVNKTQDAVKESTMDNNSAKVSVKWASTKPDVAPDEDYSCEYEEPEIDPSFEYDYELDFAVTEIQAKTVDSYSSSTVPVNVERKDYSANRNAAKSKVQNEITKRQNVQKTKETELAKLKGELPKLNATLAKAKEGHEVESCTTDPKTKKETCKTNIVVNDAEVAAAQSAIDAKQLEIDKKQCEVNEAKAWVKEYQNLYNSMVSEENKYKSTTTQVLLRLDNEEVGTQNITLQEGQKATLTFNVLVIDDGEVEAEINPDAEFAEVTFENNMLSTDIYVANYENGSCSRNSSASGVVRTITTQTDSTELMEYVTGQIVNQSRSTMRAGYGFGYDVMTTYVNEDPLSSGSGFSSNYSYFPTLVNYLPYFDYGRGYEVFMNITGTSGSTRNETRTFSLPQTFVEEYSGNVFDSNYASHPKRDSNDKIISGGRKWYVPFEQPNGNYDFLSRSYNAGVNHLSICTEGTVMVEGSYIGDPEGKDDFVKRSINPERPFKGGIGWNWKGYESLLTSQTEWWTNWKYSDPENQPDSLYYSTYDLDYSKIKSIQEYTKKTGSNVPLNSKFTSTYK